MGIAKGSNQELLEDYQDYLKQHGLNDWAKMEHQRQRYEKLLAYCRTHNDLADYDPYFAKWTDEEMANTAITLCHMVDKAMTTFMEKRDREFVEEGGVRERMTAARLDMRGTQKQIIAQQEQEIAAKEPKETGNYTPKLGLTWIFIFLIDYIRFAKILI